MIGLWILKCFLVDPYPGSEDVVFECNLRGAKILLLWRLSQSLHAGDDNFPESSFLIETIARPRNLKGNISLFTEPFFHLIPFLRLVIRNANAPTKQAKKYAADTESATFEGVSDFIARLCMPMCFGKNKVFF
jgi:hypothetical protein